MQRVEKQEHNLENAQELLITQNQELLSLRREVEKMKQKQAENQTNAAIAAAATAAATAPTPVINNVTQPAAPKEKDVLQQLVDAFNNNRNNNRKRNNNNNRGNQQSNYIYVPNDLVDGQRSV